MPTKHAIGIRTKAPLTGNTSPNCFLFVLLLRFLRHWNCPKQSDLTVLEAPYRMMTSLSQNGRSGTLNPSLTWGAFSQIQFSAPLPPPIVFWHASRIGYKPNITLDRFLTKARQVCLDVGVLPWLPSCQVWQQVTVYCDCTESDTTAIWAWHLERFLCIGWLLHFKPSRVV